MQQAHSTGGRVQEIDRDTICNQHRQQRATISGEVAVESFADHEAPLQTLAPAHRCLVKLAPDHKLPKALLERVLKHPPLPQHGAARLRSPKAEVKSTVSPSYSGNNAVFDVPILDIESWRRMFV
jgi:hypothetical protein